MRRVPTTFIPDSVKKMSRLAKRWCRIVTGHRRLLPDFIIIGAQRCGTTALYNYLSQHPHIVTSPEKEVHYFDINFNYGETWYRTHFPLSIYKNLMERAYRRPLITGEASPYYLFHPHTPKRVIQLLPSIKLIVLLRNPVDRAYSHYHHEIHLGFENLFSFEKALDQEPIRLAGEFERILADENYYSFNHQHYAYQQRGVYVTQLENWYRYFQKDQILVLSSEYFYQHTADAFRQVTELLELPAWEPKTYRVMNQTDKPQIDKRLQSRLIAYFEPYNIQLYQLLGTDFGWEGH